ncbi:MAG: enoyl-CoA hydratase/isomerase family protein, partial [Acidimicrobiia bacterium]
ARMGWQRASYVLFTSTWLDAGQAVEYGIAFARHPDDELLERALELAASIAAAPLVALRAIKQAMMAAQAPAIVAARAREDAAFAELLGGADTRAALDAFNAPG